MTRVGIPKFAIQFDSKACHTSVDSVDLSGTATG